MPQVNVTIAGRTYRMACDDGQEQHLEELARRLDETIDRLKGGFGEIGDQRLTVMSAITVLDQLVEAERRIADLEAELGDLRGVRDGLDLHRTDLERRLAERVLGAAERIENLAHALDGRGN